MTNGRSSNAMHGVIRTDGTLPVTSMLSGTPVHVVSRRLGHADVQTTLNTYAHVTDDAEMQAMANWRAFTASWRVTTADADAQNGPCS